MIRLWFFLPGRTPPDLKELPGTRKEEAPGRPIEGLRGRTEEEPLGRPQPKNVRGTFREDNRRVTNRDVPT